MTMQRYPWFQEAAKVIFEVAKDMKDCVVCLKVHPIDVPLDVYRRIAQRLGATNVRFFEEQFGELLAACDVLIGGSSTTVLEAILMGRRTICINFTDEPDRYPYVADGGSLGARSAGQLRAALDKVFSPEAQEELEAGRRAFLERHAAPSADGEGSDTFVQMLLARLRREDRDADFPAVLPPSTIRSAD
ncbi:MAG: hypothetical protein A2V70_11610 [Planctomycetes bacterium RBG_13_63_9]|nr:MAG: hypothetical protein A2V70_11610 [Planctomycetes bacterium RBG_13_63_9]